MHRPDTTPRPSLYYPYRVHDAWLPSQHPRDGRTPVVIAGGGPAGMVTALELARHGVPSVVCQADVQLSQGSRAIVFTRRSLEILQQVGVADRMTAHGLPWRFGNSFYRGQHVFRMEAPHDPDDRFYPLLNLQQQYLEQFLYEACVASPWVDFRWGNKVTHVALEDAGVRATVDTSEGEYVLEADWLVAADGGRSGIRSQLGLPMEGTSYEGLFVIADIQIDLPLPTERRAYFDPDWNPGNTVLMHRQSQGIWRVDYQLPAGESPEEALRPESLKARIDAQLAMIGFGGTPWQLDWCSVYSARTLTLPNYVHGRVVFVGDAAHLLPIFGVRGANTAFQDAQSLGWHLAYTVKGLAGPSLMANYSAERVGAAREIIAEAGKSTRFMTPPTRGFRLLRDAVLSLSLTQDFVRPLYHWRTSRPHEYTHSALNSPGDDDALFPAGPAHGAPPRNVRLGPDAYLLDDLGGGFDLLYFTTGAHLPQAVIDVVQAWRQRGVALRVTAVGCADPVHGADRTVPDPEGRAWARYGVSTSGSAYLLRPDQHVCARWITLDAPRLHAALQQALPTY
ncbi:3-(3-hydroxy-phenyl)propionate hydroxylase [Tepidimonas ignava]|uniref:3-(3-hydroxy-phenyl)propionate hydroxylase n=1 Tax=Tepidimonas ignava TaxID=114249 RepID=A0A4R3LLJ2_9BURK|nr:FAD-dependent monooxygenase [Tepidimonas ignava]TCS99434.1 3-(3-hydroxy-phenyl)propionate hydroxylase [Tepidimonas ignava]TSE21934.1 3-(3-hydroxy-phenyl)propionate/3-hydroxycinnamic acid hydroxylase [Tepidimonas ignava]